MHASPRKIEEHILVLGLGFSSAKLALRRKNHRDKFRAESREHPSRLVRSGEKTQWKRGALNHMDYD
jgi:hypothetical protein